MIDWNIQSRSHVCQACQQPFADKQPYHTLLHDRKSAYVRLDVCEACWADRAQRVPAEKGALVSHWQGIFTVPPPAPPDPIQRETAETLLRKLVELRDPAYVGAMFILAVMLERKRLLKVKAQEQHDGHRVLLYEDPRTGDLFTVLDPSLHLTQLEQVQHTVMQLLQHGLPQAAPVPAPDQPGSQGLEAPPPPSPVDPPPTQSPSPG